MPAAQTQPVSQSDLHESTSPPPSYKRRRIALACTSCRNRKSRCNGSKPSCSLCVELGFECVYQQPAAGNTKPSQGSSGYDERLSAIEDTLRRLVQQKEQSPEESEQSGHGVELGVRQRAGTQQPPHAPSDGEDVAILDDDASGDRQDAGDDSVDGMAAITDPEEKGSRFYGPSSNIALLREISDATSASLKAIGQSRHAENGLSQAIVSRAVSPVTTLPPETSPFARHGINIRSLPPEKRALHLIKLFFLDTGMLFPYVHETGVLGTFVAVRRNRYTAVSRSWLCLLNVIFAFATYLSARPDQTAEQNAAESEIFIERAQALASEIEMKSASLETVQCLLLMAQYRQGTQRSDQAWNLHGLAVRAALQLGLHSQAAAADCSLLEAEVRKRVWFACFVLDRTLCMTFGRPPTIPNEYVKLDLPINQKLEKLVMTTTGSMSAPNERLDPPDTVCFYIATIQLYYILGDIITQLYGSNVDSDPNLPIPTMLERTLSLEQRLSAWKRNLFPQLQRRPWDTLDPDSVSASTWDPVFDRLSVIITLRYLNTRILLHRPVLSAFLRKRACYRSIGVESDEEDPYFQDLAGKSLKICGQSAMEIVQIVHKTSKPPTMLGAWWFSTYYTFNAALVIFACTLLEMTTVNKWSQDGATITSAPSVDCDKVIEMISRLRSAADTLQRFGEGTRSSKRIRRTLVKLVQICMTLAQFSPEYGPVILSTLSSQQQPLDAASQLRAQLESGIHMQDAAGLDGPVLATDAMGTTTMSADDPFTVFDMNMPHYWTDTNLDLFSDLVGVDTGIAAMLSG
ncbi:hypothetical protein H2202_002399 [Exophiala xenobiotica]|nr:hypothetical protein H2202_002399 [Exophiala xenobiotica]KAK5234713.1 hypothetical protein LTR47_004157 [Exophiala xenobiotica]KAK5251704.1 hypothetical protein LTS06_003646 [Exophiala xenobiotica]KAK5261422.1 hypothetical protein LTR40_002237 [Exophiala xenobiotica]KAK5313195.1 hypothetical protein LTR93_011043 [Exophiala xenobiotica]